jgi:hypothetical protein
VLAWLRRIIVSLGIGGASYAIMLAIMVLSVVYDLQLEPVIKCFWVPIPRKTTRTRLPRLGCASTRAPRRDLQRRTPFAAGMGATITSGVSKRLRCETR